MKATTVSHIFFFTLLAGATGLFLWMLGSYILPVFWAVVIAVIFYPLYERQLALVRGRAGLASFMTIGAVIVIVVVPLILIGGLVVKESIGLYQSISNETQASTFNLSDRIGALSVYLEPLNIEPAAIEERLRTSVAQGAEAVTSSLLRYSQFTIEFAVKIAVTFYLLFFLFKYGSRVRHRVRDYMPMKSAHEQQLINRFVETTQAVVQGNLSIALLQGFIGAVTLWVAGVSAPVLWGVVMAVFAIIPALGASLVLFPAGVILIVTGSLWSGVFVLVMATLVVGLLDDFLRPILVGRKARIPDAVVLLSTIGGLATFGISGFVLGPVIAAFCLSLWSIFGEEYKSYLRQ